MFFFRCNARTYLLVLIKVEMETEYFIQELWTDRLIGHKIAVFSQGDGILLMRAQLHRCLHPCLSRQKEDIIQHTTTT